MAKQDKTSVDDTNKPKDQKNNSGKQSGPDDSAEISNKNPDPESEFAVNELREEKRDSQ